MNEKIEKLTIRLPLEGELLEDFMVLRDYYGIKTGSDLMRFLIRKDCRELQRARSS